MTASIYHFFRDLYKRRRGLQNASFSIDKHYPWPDDIISCDRNKAKFPDIILKTNSQNSKFTGGEMIEIKEARGYQIPSFNSTLPSGSKAIREIAKAGSAIHKQMLQNEGIDPYQLPIREVYYLLRGHKENNTKICLIHGSFFETLPADENIKQAFAQVIDDALQDNDVVQEPLLDDAKQEFMQLRWRQSYFSKTRQVKNSSIKIRMRLMAEVHERANILNSTHYPNILDNTLNMIVPLTPSDATKEKKTALMKTAFAAPKLPQDISVFTIQHFLGQEFLVFQSPFN